MNEAYAYGMITPSTVHVLTFGGDGLWYARRGGEPRARQPYAIEPIDTTGAGDSFRAGVAYGILREWDDERIVAFASAVATCVCLTVPHTLNAPGLDAILAFMEEQRPASRTEDTRFP